MPESSSATYLQQLMLAELFKHLALCALKIAAFQISWLHPESLPVCQNFRHSNSLSPCHKCYGCTLPFRRPQETFPRQLCEAQDSGVRPGVEDVQRLIDGQTKLREELWSDVDRVRPLGTHRSRWK